MSYNPFDDEFNKLKGQIADLENNIDIIKQKIKCYDSKDEEILNTRRLSIINEKIHCENRIEYYRSELNHIKNEISDVNGKIKSKFNPLNWFDSEQKELEKKKKILLSKQQNEKSHLNDYEKSLPIHKKLQEEIESEIIDCQRFDRSKQIEIVSTKVNKLRDVAKVYNELKPQKEAVDIKLEPIINKIESYNKEIEELEKRREQAESYERKLNRASNSYERREIHELCEYALGEGSPRNIINHANNKLKILHRDLEKTKLRAAEIGQKFSREIKKIIIDGNNMCYEGNDFVGINPLKHIISELEKKYEVLVIFDTSIKRMQKNYRNLDSISTKSKIHIVNDGPADRTILDCAETDNTSYILSNDRFGDYTEKNAIKEKRIIRFEIVDGRVIISDLNINLDFKSSIT